MMLRRGCAFGVLAALAIGTAPGVWAAGGSGVPEGYVASYSMELEEGSGLFRITLTEKAIGRLGIQTISVGFEKADRKFVIGGDIVNAADHLPATVATADLTTGSLTMTVPELWISIPIFEEIERSAHLPIRFRKIGSRETDASHEALPVPELNSLVTADGGGRLFYAAPADSGLRPGDRVLVEADYVGNGVEHQVVPYSAILYDRNGDEWVYVNSESNVFVRRTVDISYVDGDRAFLLEGPGVGEKVVAVGAAELLGIEYRVGH